MGVPAMIRSSPPPCPSSVFVRKDLPNTNHRAMPDGATKPMKVPRTSLACAPCSERKKSCSWALRAHGEDGGASGACERCRRLGSQCVPQDGTVPRRVRERRRRAEKWREAHARSAPADPDAQGADEAGGRRDALLDTSPTVMVVARPEMAVPVVQMGPLSPVPDMSPFGHPWPAPYDAPATQALAAPPIPREPGNSYSHYLLPALEGYWNCFHVPTPIVHRKTFEAAFLAGDSSVYGSRQPTALMYAMAANGVRFADIPGPVDDARLQISRHYCTIARDLVLSSYYGRAGDAVMSHLEAVQTIYLIYNYLLPEYGAPAAFVLLQRGLEILLVLSGSLRGQQQVGFKTPQDHIEWVRNEMIVRLFIIFGLWDTSYAYLTGRELLHDYFATRTALPCSEAIFNLSSEEAFSYLCPHPATGTPPWRSIDFSRITDGSADTTEACHIVASITSYVFNREAGHMALVYLLAFLRQCRFTLRQLAEGYGIDPIVMAAKQARIPNEEAIYRAKAELLQTMVDQFINSIPENIGMPLAEGNPEPLFALAPGNIFPDIPYTHTFLCTYICIRAIPIENWLPPEESDPSLRFFQSETFLNILEIGIIICRLLESQLAMEPQLRWSRPYTVMPVLRVGGLHVAAVKLCQQAAEESGAPLGALDGAKEDARIAWRWVDAMARIHRPMGRYLANSFRRVLRNAGIEDDAVSGAAIAAEEYGEEALPVLDPVVGVVGGEVPSSFSGTVLAGEKWARPYLK